MESGTMLSSRTRRPFLFFFSLACHHLHRSDPGPKWSCLPSDISTRFQGYNYLHKTRDG